MGSPFLRSVIPPAPRTGQPVVYTGSRTIAPRALPGPVRLRGARHGRGRGRMESVSVEDLVLIVINLLTFIAVRMLVDRLLD